MTLDGMVVEDVDTHSSSPGLLAQTSVDDGGSVPGRPPSLLIPEHRGSVWGGESWMSRVSFSEAGSPTMRGTPSRRRGRLRRRMERGAKSVRRGVRKLSSVLLRRTLTRSDDSKDDDSLDFLEEGVAEGDELHLNDGNGEGNEEEEEEDDDDEDEEKEEEEEYV